MRGSTEKRTREKGTVWTARIDLAPDPVTGKRRQRRITAATKKELDALVAEAITEAKRGVTGFADAGKLSLRAYLDQWLETVAPTLRPSTVRRYRDLCRKHVDGVLGGVVLAKLTTADLQRLYANRLAAGLSSTTVRHVHGVLHRALAQAVEWRLIVVNPADRAKPPRRSTPEMRIWDAAQVAAFLAAAADDDLEALWRLLLLGGLRRGEALGLRWSDLDLDRASASIRRSLSRGGTSRLEEREPKTKAGKRQVALPASAVASLLRHRDRQAFAKSKAAEAYEDRGLVFAGPTGAPLHPNTVARGWSAATKAAKLPAIRLHDARHTCASLLLAQGVNPKVVQERLGHTDIAMTLNLYSHLVESVQRGAADALDDALTRAVDGAAAANRDPSVTQRDSTGQVTA